MKIYLDLLIILNLDLDFVLLLSVSIILKRNIKLRRIFLGSLFGSFTIFLLFIKMSSLLMIIFKIVLGLLMVIVTFGYKDIRYTLNNFYYLMINSIIVGGGLYLIRSYVYYNYLILILGFIVIMFIYLIQYRRYKNNYDNYVKVDIYIKNKLYKLNGYLDTGNKLYDQYHHRPVILINKKIDYRDEEIIYVPYASLNNTNLLKCIKPNKIIINQKVYKNYLIGLSNNKFMIEGINCILHSNLKGEL